MGIKIRFLSLFDVTIYNQYKTMSDRKLCRRWSRLREIMIFLLCSAANDFRERCNAGSIYSLLVRVRGIYRLFHCHYVHFNFFLLFIFPIARRIFSMTIAIRSFPNLESLPISTMQQEHASRPRVRHLSGGLITQ